MAEFVIHFMGSGNGTRDGNAEDLPKPLAHPMDGRFQGGNADPQRLCRALIGRRGMSAWEKLPEQRKLLTLSSRCELKLNRAHGVRRQREGPCSVELRDIGWRFRRLDTVLQQLIKAFRHQTTTALQPRTVAQ